MATWVGNEWQVECKEIAGRSVAELAEKFGTPTYIYNAATIRERLEQLRDFDVIRYAQKANSNLAILDLMRRAGVVVDAVSAGEIFRALQAGYAPQAAAGEPHPIVYTADVFDREALQMVAELGLHVNVGSLDMIPQLGAVRPGGSVTIRINPGFGHGHSQKTNTGGPSSKHGIWHADLPKACQMADQAGLRVTGLHMHIGSGTDFEHLAQVSQAMEQAVRDSGVEVDTISAGGGLPTPYQRHDQPIDLPRYFAIWDEMRQNLQRSVGRPIRLEIEPGRYPVAEAGYLVAEIRAVKTMGPNRFYLLDAGFNNLARPILYGAYHPMAVATRDGRMTSQTWPVVVGGPLCESGDIFTQTDGGVVVNRELPVAEVGDYLVIGCAGAYGFVMGSNYNSKTLAAEVLLDDGEAFLIRERQTLADLIRGEKIPDRS